LEHGLEIIPVLNKIDLPGNAKEVTDQIVDSVMPVWSFRQCQQEGTGIKS
jgi:translation elongation factor EF-4